MGKIIDKKIISLAKDVGFSTEFHVFGNKFDLYVWMCKLQRFIREAHKIYVEVNVDFEPSTNELWHNTFVYSIQREGKNTIEVYMEVINYDDALEAGLTQALELL